MNSPICAPKFAAWKTGPRCCEPNFCAPVRRRSNLPEGVIKDHLRKTFQKEPVPPEILASLRFLRTSPCQVVQVSDLTDDGPHLVERFAT